MESVKLTTKRCIRFASLTETRIGTAPPWACTIGIQVTRQEKCHGWLPIY